MSGDLLTLFTEDPHFPRDSLAHMVAYVARRRPDILREPAPSVQEPMSVVHKWCIDALRTWGKPHDFPTRTKWQHIQGGLLGISQQFLAWLDLLKMDRLLFEDEAHRVGVPRLTEDGEIVVALQIQPLRTRKETQDFLVAEGAQLFEERGWHDGLKLWKEKTRPFY